MSNQLDNGFEGSQPFITDDEYKSLSIDQLRYILNQKKKELKKDYKQLTEKEKIIRDIRRVDKLNKKVLQGIDIKKKYRKKKKKQKKLKTFEDYFENCIKNKKIPKDTPDYLRKAIKRALYEHEQGIEIEKSALDRFATKYILKGRSGIRPAEFFNSVFSTVEGMLKNNRNTKFKMVLVCLFERIIDQGIERLEEYEAFFSTTNYKNLQSTNIENKLKKGFDKILKDFEEFQIKGSGWYFKEVLKLEVHTVKYNPIRGSSYIDLPDWIKNKKAIINIKNSDEKCFIWCILRYLYPKEKDGRYLKDLRKYEFSLNTKGLTFPLKLKDISKFEKLNPEIPGINVFSNDSMTIYPLRMSERDCKNTIDLFLHEKDGISHYSLIKNFHRLIKSQITKSKDGKIFICKRCHICSCELKNDKVRDHCHFTGKYRGAAHNKCNLMCKKPRVLPVIFHNLQGYDAHLFIKQLAKIDGKLDCIPSTEEKYISFSKTIKVGEYKHIDGDVIPINFEIKFLDSFKFLQTSLANLVSNLSSDDFHNTKHVFKKNTSLLTRKGVYPYDYVSSLDKLSEKCLPPKDEFYSKLNDEDISDEDYQHAIKVWNKFGCKTIKDYHDLYLKSDVLLLADVFEKFRSTCLKHYKLDPVHYYTSPGLAWDACLKITGQNLELLSDYDMLMMFERGIRGGITHISKRYAEANNKYMKNYDPEKKSTFIQYLDANNLYGWAMSQNLPTHGFKWMKDITLEKVYEILDKINCSMLNNGKKGYIFEVDLEYPKNLWETHNDYPLAPEKIIVNGVEKLICHFKPRKNYVVHYRNLRQYLEMGMKITAVHRAISFYQSPWMEPYIRKNTELRKTAANSFKKDFFKLMNNSVFGKTIENIRKRQNIHLVDNRKKALKLSSLPNFDRCTIFDSNLIAIHMKKTEVYFNKPVYVGQSILDLSKTLMFDFHYKYIKKKYGKKSELLFTDTDSLMYEIKTEDFYKDISPDILSKFDTSDYPNNHKSGIITGVNKKVIGAFKDEVAGKQITHFVGLRPKLYSFKIEEESEVRKCKGIKKNVIKNKLDFDDYVKCLFSGEKKLRSMKIIRSEKHNIYSKEVNKIALSNEDDKRHVLQDKIYTLALR